MNVFLSMYCYIHIQADLIVQTINAKFINVLESKVSVILFYNFYKI